MRKRPNSFEPLELRNLLNEYVDELNFKLKKDPKPFEEAFSNWISHQTSIATEQGHTHLVLKHPLLIFFCQLYIDIVMQLRFMSPAI